MGGWECWKAGEVGEGKGGECGVGEGGGGVVLGCGGVSEELCVCVCFMFLG